MSSFDELIEQSLSWHAPNAVNLVTEPTSSFDIEWEPTLVNFDSPGQYADYATNKRARIEDESADNLLDKTFSLSHSNRRKHTAPVQFTQLPPSPNSLIQIDTLAHSFNDGLASPVRIAASIALHAESEELAIQPKASKSRKRRTEEEWKAFAPTIDAFYQRLPLPKVMELMKTLHGFDAPATAYKERFKRKKNLSKRDKGVLRAYTQRRKAQNRRTGFRYHGQIVQMKRIERGEAEELESVGTPSLPANVSVFTPSEASYGKRLVDARRSNSPSLDFDTSLEEGIHQFRTTTVIHQQTDFCPPLEPAVPNATEIEDRLDKLFWNHRLLNNELSGESLDRLLELSQTFSRRRHDWGGDMIQESILEKSQEMSDAGIEVPIDISKYQINLIKSYLLERRFYVARTVLTGIIAAEDFHASPAHFRLQIWKFMILAEVKEELAAPSRLCAVEKYCESLILEENSMPRRSEPYRPTNLLLAYLFRLYIINDAPPNPGISEKLKQTLRDQMRIESPSRSLVWTAQQYARWCLLTLQYDEATNILSWVDQILKGFHTSGQSEVEQNSRLREVCSGATHVQNNSRRSTQYRPARKLEAETFKADLIEISNADKNLLDALHSYLWGGPTPPQDLTVERRINTRYWD